MCNAHNHPPGCNCGWGQGWYSGSYGSTFINAGYRYMNKQSFLTMEEKEWRQRVKSFLESKEKKVELSNDVDFNESKNKDHSIEEIECSIDYFNDFCNSWMKEKEWIQLKIKEFKNYSGKLYKLKNELITLFFRLDRDYQLIHARYIPVDYSSASISLIVEDLESHCFYQLEGPASLGNSFPPGRKLTIKKSFLLKKESTREKDELNKTKNHSIEEDEKYDVDLYKEEKKYNWKYFEADSEDSIKSEILKLDEEIEYFTLKILDLNKKRTSLYKSILGTLD